jgi:hypothetical protein
MYTFFFQFQNSSQHLKHVAHRNTMSAASLLEKKYELVFLE